MENLVFYACAALSVLCAAFTLWRSSESLGTELRVRSLERSVAAELAELREEIPKAEISLAGQLLEATGLVETVRHTQKKMAGRQGGRGNKAEPELSYLDESLPRETRHALMREQLGV